VERVVPVAVALHQVERIAPTDGGVPRVELEPDEARIEARDERVVPLLAAERLEVVRLVVPGDPEVVLACGLAGAVEPVGERGEGRERLSPLAGDVGEDEILVAEDLCLVDECVDVVERLRADVRRRPLRPCLSSMARTSVGEWLKLRSDISISTSVNPIAAMSASVRSRSIFAASRSV